MAPKRKITVALVGNPNTGKSTFFNAWTGLHQVTGNWPGVTVEKLMGEVTLPGGEEVTVVDLPGIYSLHAVSQDEAVASEYARSGEPDLIVNVVDVVNLERNLYLTLALAELGKPMVVVLTMTDIFARQGFGIKIGELSERLGLPVVTGDLHRRGKRAALEQAILEALATKQQPPCVVYPDTLNQAMLRAHRENEPQVRAIHRLEGIIPGGEEIIAEMERVLGTTPDVIMAAARYDRIAEITQGLVSRRGHARTELGRTLDRLALNRWLGIPIFLGIMYILFWFTQVVGGCFIDFFDGIGDALFVTGLGNVLTLVGAPQWLITILADGLGTGIQTVLTFIPPVFFIFWGLSFLEDSGYMARAACVMDRFMRLLGLPGSAFVPMLVGFGCTVPAIMATRTLSNRRDRLLTIFMAPFMSCGARLPVYALFGAAFFGVASGTMVFAIYMSGIVLAVLTGILLKHTLFVGEPSPFVLELPLYHVPRFHTVLGQAWKRLSHFVFRAGKVMAVMVLLLSLCDKVRVPNVYGNRETRPNVPIIEFAGRAIAPIFAPMGVESDNWQGSVSLIVGLFAKEQVVSALNTLYAIDGSMVPAAGEAEEESAPLTWRRAAAEFRTGVGEAFASVPEAFSGLLDTLFDPLGVSIFKSDLEHLASAAEDLREPGQPPERLAVLRAEFEGALGLDALRDAVGHAEATARVIAEEALTNPQLAGQAEAAEADLGAAKAALADAVALQHLVIALTDPESPLGPEAYAARTAELAERTEALYAEELAASAEGDATLMKTLRTKFDNDRNRAFAYLLFVLLYVPCLAAMATVIREIGWKYSTVLFSYLTLLGWCVATLYFQITTAHQPLWLIVPCVILAAVAAVFYALGRKFKIRMVV